MDSETGLVSGGESGVDEDDYKEDGWCLVKGEEGVKGYRHHCGGDIDLTVEGQYDHPINGWTPLDTWELRVNFGPTLADEWLENDDLYETPFVAACCGGPFDFESTDADYANAYALNCALDAVQQICNMLPKYFEALGNKESGVVRDKLWEVADHLNNGAVQDDCIATLMEEDDPEHLLSNRSWQIIDNAIMDITITINVLQILEWDYPDNPNDVADCTSIYENDDNTTPLVETLVGDVENFTIMAGDGALTNNDDVTEILDPGAASLLSLVQDASSGNLEIRNLVLRDNQPITIFVDSIPVVVDRWSLRLLQPVTASPVLGNYLYLPGSMSFVASAVYMGDVISLVGTNIGTVYVYADSLGWVMQGLEVEYNDNGTLWSYSATNMEFQ